MSHTSLMLAIKEGNRFDLAKILTAKKDGVNINLIYDNFRLTPFQYACYLGNEEIVDTLVEHGACVHAADGCSFRYTALHAASLEGHVSVISTLLKHGADVNAVNKDGNTALHFSSCKLKGKVIQTLLEHGADIHCVNVDGITPLELMGHRLKDIYNEEFRRSQRHPILNNPYWSDWDHPMVVTVLYAFLSSKSNFDSNEYKNTSLLKMIHEALWEGNSFNQRLPNIFSLFLPQLFPEYLVYVNEKGDFPLSYVISRCN